MSTPSERAERLLEAVHEGWRDVRDIDPARSALRAIVETLGLGWQDVRHHKAQAEFWAERSVVIPIGSAAAAIRAGWHQEMAERLATLLEASGVTPDGEGGA